jgi:hypothetical protein
MQQNFSSYVLQKSKQIPIGIKANGIAPEKRLAIYRNNTQLGLTEVLRAVYPVVNKLVGEAFFNQLAKDYINIHPLPSACLLEFGGQFAELIASLPVAEILVYLADIATLEWLWHQAYHEENRQPLDLSALGRLDATDYNRLGFKLHPSARFLSSDYPIAQIWESNQFDNPTDKLIDLQQGGCKLLIYRPEFDVEIVTLSHAEYQCLLALSARATFLAG